MLLKPLARRSLSNYVPYVVKRDPQGGGMVMDIFSRLQAERVVMISGAVTDATASVITAQLLFLESENPEKPIQMYINSPGGSVTAGLAIYDTMRYVKPDVHTLVLGQACSMGAFLLAGGDKRIALPNARIMIHQPSGGFEGTAADMYLQTKEILRLRERLNSILAHHTKQPISEIEKVIERDHWMDAEEGKKFGIIDEIVTNREDIKKSS
jgi:ATP-dependent Clp protease protease subunit